MRRHEEPAGGRAYEPPELTELGSLTVVTLADGTPLGKVEGGSDAFLMRGHGSISTASV